TLDSTGRTMHLTPVLNSSASSSPVRQSPTQSDPPREVQTRIDRTGGAISSPAFAEPSIWKIGYQWPYRWHSPRGAGTFVWSVEKQDVVDGVPVHVVKSGQRELLYRRSDLALILERVQGTTETRWTPPLINYSWPLTLGKTWEQTFTR